MNTNDLKKIINESMSVIHKLSTEGIPGEINLILGFEGTSFDAHTGMVKLALQYKKQCEDLLFSISQQIKNYPDLQQKFEDTKLEFNQVKQTLDDFLKKYPEYIKAIIKDQELAKQLKKKVNEQKRNDQQLNEQKRNDQQLKEIIKEQESSISTVAGSWKVIKDADTYLNKKINPTLEAADKMLELMEKYRSKNVSQKTYDEGKVLSDMYERALAIANKQTTNITSAITNTLTKMNVSNLVTDEDMEMLRGEVEKEKKVVEKYDQNEDKENKQLNKQLEELSHLANNEDSEQAITDITNDSINNTMSAVTDINMLVVNKNISNNVNTEEIRKHANFAKYALEVINSLLEIYPENEIKKVACNNNVNSLIKNMDDIKEYAQDLKYLQQHGFNLSNNMDDIKEYAQDLKYLQQHSFNLSDKEVKVVLRSIGSKLLNKVYEAKASLDELDTQVKNLQKEYKGSGFFKKRIVDWFSKDALVRKVALGQTPSWINKSKKQLENISKNNLNIENNSKFEKLVPFGKYK